MIKLSYQARKMYCMAISMQEIPVTVFDELSWEAKAARLFNCKHFWRRKGGTGTGLVGTKFSY